MDNINFLSQLMNFSHRSDQRISLIALVYGMIGMTPYQKDKANLMTAPLVIAFIIVTIDNWFKSNQDNINSLRIFINQKIKDLSELGVNDFSIEDFLSDTDLPNYIENSKILNFLSYQYTAIGNTKQIMYMDFYKMLITTLVPSSKNLSSMAPPKNLKTLGDLIFYDSLVPEGWEDSWTDMLADQNLPERLKKFGTLLVVSTLICDEDSFEDYCKRVLPIDTTINEYREKLLSFISLSKGDNNFSNVLKTNFNRG